ncbi:tannase/feruloyl esterase family alpha/beta hydrolase [Bradyrhizobium sp. AUGA SZCCT0042]|uniref:tannase/feruloyl esterase family alpha/beta hydrolase n=1 Tax=Bradyrhizobium sp. AUGA SZCCT0042 TaxID=2807651 RepID=UPI001BAC4CC5|nr:tannase/feruloyl esterase family alpha/beta hydrolase [Bradyrhizobium sp. AUGA SZCCT0042]MBR1297800.1 tannase/feruloyl esterase family alpha/beta hydrolase [Bradyrhizobium sp. AUGA SZCCT0042]
MSTKFAVSRPITTTVFLCGLIALPALAAAAERPLGADPVAACAALSGAGSGAIKVDTAALTEAKPLTVAPGGPTPAARISPATPQFCRVLGHIDPTDPKAPPIRFQLNLPLQWNGRSVQYGGGGFNGVLITGLSLPPAAPFDSASPLARGFATYGTDSGHETKPGEPPQLFAANDEAFVNFAHASYKKVRDAAAMLMERAYGAKPERMYFVGSSEGGREGLTMAQRYPADFDGIFARVPVINWVGLQHAGTRAGLATWGEGWIRPAKVKLVHDAVLAACDAQDGVADALVEDAVGCKARFDPAKLLCASGTSGDACLSEAQLTAIRTLLSPYKFPFALANGVTEYPGWGVSGEGTKSFGPTGGWSAWWLGSAPPALPPVPANGIAWVYGAGGIAHIFARDPNFDVRKYRVEDFAERVREVSALMDSTNPDLSAFKARGGKLIMLEYMADYAQSPYAGIGYFEQVQKRMGEAATAEFARLYAAPGVDHVGSGAPANVDMLSVLVDWVEHGRAPGNLTVVEQQPALPITVDRSLPLCQWPAWPQYKSGDSKNAASFVCGR